MLGLIHDDGARPERAGNPSFVEAAIPAGAADPCVVIIQAAVPEYRVPFFKQLAAQLGRHGVRLQVLWGSAGGPTVRTTSPLPAELGRPVANRWFLGGRLLYQPVMRYVNNAAMVVVEPANKHIANLGLAALAATGRTRLAFWGHGRNRRVHDRSLRELPRRILARRADWWFAYTEGTAAYLRSVGVDADVITTATNTIDTVSLGGEIKGVAEQEVTAWRRSVGMPSDAVVGLFCGSLYPAKALDFLLTAAHEIHARHPTFRLVIAGDGPDAPLVRAEARSADWIHYIGSVAGRQKALALRNATVFLNPGAVGLGIVDAFVAGLPFLTVERRDHGPEIEYLRPGMNGLTTSPDPRAYARATVAILTDAGRREALSDAARRSASGLSLEIMVQAFSDGILECMARPPRRLDLGRRRTRYRPIRADHPAGHTTPRNSGITPDQWSREAPAT